MKEKVIVVHLRRPRRLDLNDSRRDPFWEFGSFGLTGCHGRNLMHPGRAEELVGARLAFAQGGPQGTRLVYLTPPIVVVRHSNAIEAMWTPSPPFKYREAPLLVDRLGNTEFPRLKRTIREVASNAWTSKFMSRYRSRREPLDSATAREVIRIFRAICRSKSILLAKDYDDALPFPPRTIDKDRKLTYTELLARARRK